MNKKYLIAVVFTVLFGLILRVGVSEAKVVNVKGYVKKNGTFVMPYIKTSPNRSRLDNYSSKGNVNPFTGKKGTVEPNKIKRLIK